MSVKGKFNRPKGMSSSQWDKVTGATYDILTKNTPVKTGNLRSAIQVTNTSRQVRFGYSEKTAPYAKYLQEGTPKMASRDMIGKTQRDLAKLSKVKK